jgi:hypothetical protein
MNQLRIAIVVVISCTVGCGRPATPRAAQAPKLPALRDLPMEMTVEQRSTTVVPGSNELLRITIEDITGGQVLVSLASNKGESVLAATSLKAGESSVFTLEGNEYELTLDELENNLVGEDFARFVISDGAARPPQKEAGSAGPMSERERIEWLLSQIELDEGATFFRNGAEHSPQAAADHLRSKWKAAGDEVKTADDFIEKIASESSLSGEPYRVRLDDGTEVLAGDYLRQELSKIEDGQTNSQIIKRDQLRNSEEGL